MNRALAANAELSFDMTPDLAPDHDTDAILDDTDRLLEIRRGNMNLNVEQKTVPIKTRSSPRIARKLRFTKDTHGEDMDTT